MSSAECNAILDIYNSEYRNQWEQTRYIAFINAAINSDKIQTPTDLLKFPWEFEADIKTISKEERIQREQEMLKWLVKK